jgi:predicted ATPase/DNA-binding CsgD family transcriptional regulator
MADATPPPREMPVDDRKTDASRPHETSGDDPPLGLTSFVGREREISELERLLADGARLLTLTGPGGSGKTRLASALALEVVEGFEDGVWWVDLAPVLDPDLVPQAVAKVLNVPETPGRSLTDAIAEDLRELEILIVLDNCEHLVEACALLAEALLRACRGLVVLATSREALGIAGEKNFPVPPLSLPDPEHLRTSENLAKYEAIKLFVDRARAVAPDFRLTEANAPGVATLCERLDGMPLAIELAAARVRVLSVEQISSRLDESFDLLAGDNRTASPRQRTLGAAMDWSHDLLSEKERILFRRLSVFAGGFTLDGAEAVCVGEGVEPEEVIDLLSDLVAKSLVVVAERDGAARYRLLETVRQYASDKLEGSREAERVRERHARYYLALAEAAESELEEQEAWLLRLEAEHANFRAVLSWALYPQDEVSEARAELGLRLAASLAEGRFWNAYGPNEGQGWLEKALARSDASPEDLRAKAFSHAGFLAIWHGDYQRSAALLEEAMALYKELGDKPGVATSIFQLGNMAWHAGDHKRGRALRLEAEALRLELADPQAIGLLLYFLGMAAVAEGDHDLVMALSEEGLELNRELGDLRGMAMCLTLLGVSALEQRDHERAAALYEEDLRLLRQLKDKTGTAYGLRGMAGAAALRGDAARAARLWGTAEAVGEAIGLPLSPFDRIHPDYEALLNTARLGDEATWEAALAEGRTMTPEEAIEYALTSEQTTPASKKATASPLSARETEIVALVAEGLTNPQVAQRLYLSPRTVGQHLRSIYRKLGVSSRAAAAREASERELI